MARTTPVHSGYTIINGTTTGSNGSKCDTWIEYKVTSQSVVNNTSTLVAYLYTCANYSNSTSYSSTANYGYLTYDSGTKQYTSISGYDFTNQTPVLFASYTFTISHNTDGTKQITLQGAWSTSHSTYISGGNVSAQVTLPQIARASSVSNMTTFLGTAGTITISRQSSSFTHTITYSFGSASGTLATKTSSTTITWTPPVNLIAQITNASSKTGTITCETFSGNTSVGTSTSTLTLKVPNSTLANVSANIGTSTSFSVSNPVDTQLTFTVAYTIGSTPTTIQTKQSRNVTYTFPSSLIAQIPNAPSGTGTITVTTYNGTASVGSVTAELFLVVPPASSQQIIATMGVATTIPINKVYGDLEVTVSFVFSTQNGTIVTKTKNNSVSYTFVTNTFAPLVTTGTSGNGTITFTTYNGTQIIGVNTYTLTLIVPASEIPTGTLSVSLSNSNPTISGWGIGVQGYTRASATLDGSGISGSTIATMSVNGEGINRTQTYSTSTATLTIESSVINKKGILNYQASVIDSRGRGAVVASQSITIYEYNPPTIDVTSLKRCQQDGTEDSSGRWLLPVFDYDYKTCDNHNTASTYVRYKKANANSWETPVAITTDTPADLDLDPQYNYIIQPYISDALNTTYAAEISVPSAQRILNINASGKGLAIGGFSQNSGELEVFYPSDFDSTVNIDGAVTMNDGASVTNGLTVNNYDMLDGLIYKGLLTSADDLNDITDAGIYYINDPMPSNCPTGATYSKLFVTGKDNVPTQIIVRADATSANIWTRIYGGNPLTWRAWKTFTDIDSTQALIYRKVLTSADDLDTLYGKYNQGYYYINGSTPINSPFTSSTVWTILVVIGSTGGYTQQFFVDNRGGNYPFIWMRQRSGNPQQWGSWVGAPKYESLFYKSGDTSSPNSYIAHGYLSESGKRMRFQVELAKKRNNVTTSLSTLKINAYGSAGYCIGTSYISGGKDVLNDSAYTVTVAPISDFIVRIQIDRTTAFNGTNNTPIIVELNSVTFSFS